MKPDRYLQTFGGLAQKELLVNPVGGVFNFLAYMTDVPPEAGGGVAGAESHGGRGQKQ